MFGAEWELDPFSSHEALWTEILSYSRFTFFCFVTKTREIKEKISASSKKTHTHTHPPLLDFHYWFSERLILRQWFVLCVQSVVQSSLWVQSCSCRWQTATCQTQVQFITYRTRINTRENMYLNHLQGGGAVCLSTLSLIWIPAAPHKYHTWRLPSCSPHLKPRTGVLSPLITEKSGECPEVFMVFVFV